MKSNTNNIKSLLFFLFFFTSLALFKCETTYAYSFTTNGTTSIGGYSGTDEYVHVPTYYDNTKITTINSYAFDSCVNLKAITLPDSVTSLYGYAIYNCSNLKTVVIPASVTYISDYFIYGNNSVTIYGVPGSAANTYATNNNFVFKDISELQNKISFESNSIDTKIGQQITTAYTYDSSIITGPVSLLTFYKDTTANITTFDSCGFVSIIAYNGLYRAEAIVNVTPSTPRNFVASYNSDLEANILTWEYIESYTSDYSSDYYYYYPSYNYITNFKIYRSLEKDGSYTLVSTVPYYNVFEYYDYDIRKGLTYYYKIQVETIVEGSSFVGDFIAHNGVNVALDQALTITSINATKSHSITIEWPLIDCADGYYLYTSTDNVNFTLLESYAQNYETYNYKYKHKKLNLRQTYYYKVSAYVTINNTNYIISTTDVVSEIVRINGVKITKASSNKPRQNTIKWKKNKEADGYIIYYSKKENGKYKKIKTIKNPNKLTFTHKKLTNGKSYYYKVVGYQIINGRTYTGIENAPYLKYCDYYTYENESYESKYKRIFGKKKSGYYTSATQAKKNMKTIKVKVWDLNSNGKKYTRTFSITVHKNLAPSVKQMFKEIYKSKERFPIHDLGAYSWRSSNPNSEHCIGTAFDINANENYMIDGGKILSGSFWKPKKNPYSIPLKCELVKILKKYGFYRGFWWDRKDYMHFSYFGG